MAVNWERVHTHEPRPQRGLPPFEPTLLRARVPGGWLVTIDEVGVTFVPDADGTWEPETTERGSR